MNGLKSNKSVSEKTAPNPRRWGTRSSKCVNVRQAWSGVKWEKTESEHRKRKEKWRSNSRPKQQILCLKTVNKKQLTARSYLATLCCFAVTVRRNEAEQHAQKWRKDENCRSETREESRRSVEETTTKQTSPSCVPFHWIVIRKLHSSWQKKKLIGKVLVN